MAVLSAALLGQGPPPPPRAGEPLPRLTPEERGRFETGKASFLEEEDPPGGLGPVFTEASCVACHNTPAPGGSGRRLTTRIGRYVQGAFDPLVEFGGPLLQDRGIGPFNGVNFTGEIIPSQATVIARRRTSPLFGLGLVDHLSDAQILEEAQMQAILSPWTAGRVNVVADPGTGESRVGRFGWKAQHASLFVFVGDAYTNEMGVTTPLFPDENCPQGDCTRLSGNPATSNPNDPDNQDVQTRTDFVAFLAPPPRGRMGRNEHSGERIFLQIGCADCHRPSWQTATRPTSASGIVTFAPYSDFLLHDMGSLGDGIVQEQASGREMRTAPLWGVGLQQTLLHDGRAKTLEQAILAHDGQAESSRSRFKRLSHAQRRDLTAFLNSL